METTVTATAPDVEPVKTDPRAESIMGLRALADMLEQHPDLELPHEVHYGEMNVIPLGREEQRKQLAAWAKVLPGRKSKTGSDSFFRLTGSLHGLRIQVLCDRQEVCERVVTGTREVTEQVPDPDALAAVPKVTVTKTVEDVEWVCKPVLDAEADA